jgi:chromosome segregation ATPase
MGNEKLWVKGDNKMAFMKKDVNLGLLVLIIASIILFSGFTVYYQTTFKDVSLEYQTKMEQLSKVTQELATQKEALNETYSLRIKAEQDKETLDARYKDVSDENENLRSELISTSSELAEKKAELDATESLLSQTQATLAAANSEIDSLKSQRSDLKDDIDRICAKLVAAGGSDNECD